jgi:hypothetical protein
MRPPPSRRAMMMKTMMRIEIEFYADSRNRVWLEKINANFNVFSAAGRN